MKSLRKREFSFVILYKRYVCLYERTFINITQGVIKKFTSLINMLLNTENMKIDVQIKYPFNPDSSTNLNISMFQVSSQDKQKKTKSQHIINFNDNAQKIQNQPILYSFLKSGSRDITVYFQTFALKTNISLNYKITAHLEFKRKRTKDVETSRHKLNQQAQRCTKQHQVQTTQSQHRKRANDVKNIKARIKLINTLHKYTNHMNLNKNAQKIHDKPILPSFSKQGTKNHGMCQILSVKAIQSKHQLQTTKSQHTS
eukprot:TRINITY_DN7450_c0_g1_i2.p2 TRINITY_DN7450_c0_g1~~TRINITY_DN7450_c0_g1_i2.p2  ORF type:complete len:256 (+),score=-5.02 TRINITY_DN7450_c0_g1_i2:590-1357(+)